jgi:hypothetical protein
MRCVNELQEPHNKPQHLSNSYPYLHNSYISHLNLENS